MNQKISVKSWLLIVFVSLASACGGPESRESDAGPVPLSDPFTLEVAGGYGSGAYRAGATVHVWAAASTTSEVVLPWTGDAALLAEPTEWHTTFVMPARDVRLASNREAEAVTLTVETFNGSTSRPKTVRYYFPPGMRGVVLFSHGTGGSNTFIEGTEPFALALALVRAGYGVMGTEAEEAVAGDLNGDGKERWFASAKAFRADNVDLRNLETLFASFESRGLIPANTPKFALGMSAGGSFSHFLGTVSASAVAGDFPRLRFAAVVSYCADATAARSGPMSTTPSAWFMCGSEDNPEVSNDEAFENYQTLSGRGIPADYTEHPPSPLYDERFARIAGISVGTSRAMAAELRAAGFVDDGGFLDTDGDAIGQFVMANPGQFPTIVSQSDSLGAIRSQVKAMRAEHAMYADYTQRNIDWFERFNPNP